MHVVAAVEVSNSKLINSVKIVIAVHQIYFDNSASEKAFCDFYHIKEECRIFGILLFYLANNELGRAFDKLVRIA